MSPVPSPVLLFIPSSSVSRAEFPLACLSFTQDLELDATGSKRTSPILLELTQPLWPYFFIKGDDSSTHPASLSPWAASLLGCGPIIIIP